MPASLLLLGSAATAALLLGVVWGALGLGYRYCRRVYPERARRIDPGYAPRVALVCPCKGIDERTEANARRLLMQDYPDYTVTFVTESAEDPAVPTLARIVAEFPRARHRIAGRARHHTQKIHNILCGMLATETAGAEVLASVDIDMEVCGADWLRRLVAPLSDEKVALSTAFFRIATEGRHPVEQLCAQVTTLMELGIAAWRGWLFGGSFALRRTDFDVLGVRRIWHRALAEDVWLTLEVMRRGLEVVYVPSALSTNIPTRRLRSLWIWLTRQLQANKHFTLMFWPLLILLGAGSALLCGTPLFFGFARERPELLVPVLLGALTAIGLTAALVLVGRRPLAGGTPRPFHPTLLLIPFVIPLIFAAMVVVALRRHLIWAGIRYELAPDSSVLRVVFPDEALPDQSSSAARTRSTSHSAASPLKTASAARK